LRSAQIIPDCTELGRSGKNLKWRRGLLFKKSLFNDKVGFDFAILCGGTA